MTRSDTRDASDRTLDRDDRSDDLIANANRPKPGHGADRPSPVPARQRRVPTFGLSVTQLVATGLAAVTATIAASYLGVAGTVIGAAVASVLSAVGNAVYSTSLRTTRDRVREVVPVTRLRSGGTAAYPIRTSGTVDREPPALPASRPAPVPARPAGQRVVLKRVALIASTMFLTVLALVTAIELAAGRPLSDLLRGNSGSGTSVFGGTTVRTKTVPPTAPTVYVTVTPKVVVTTPTYTRTASPTTTTTTPSPAASTPPASAGTSGGTVGAPSSSGLPTP